MRTNMAQPDTNVHRQDNVAPTVALIVNPIAGVGGPAGLHGSDGPNARAAIAAGGALVAGLRARRALTVLAKAVPGIRLIGCANAMGADPVAQIGLQIETVYTPAHPISTSADTIAAAKVLAERRPALMLFVGGDGTARDLLASGPFPFPLLGIPAGVKMHSSIFATSPRSAGDLAATFLSQGCARDEAEIIDRDSDGAPRLYGTLMTLQGQQRRQAAKAIGVAPDALLAAACRSLGAELACDPGMTFLGPGSTMFAVKRALGIDGSLLGVDAVQAGMLIARDADQATLSTLATTGTTQLLLGVIGGQGFLLGRGNQQINAALIRRIGKGRIRVVASLTKLASIDALIVDTGDEDVDRELAGYHPIIVGIGRQAIKRIRAG